MKGELPREVSKFAITNIYLEAVEGKDNRVKFHAYSPGRKLDNGAVILGDIVETNETVSRGCRSSKKDYPIYEATILTTRELKSRIQAEFKSKDDCYKRVMLCVHGMYTRPTQWLEECSRYSGNYVVIPVIWPCHENGFASYFNDKGETSPEVTLAFKELLGLIPGDIPQSIMCHSMGNYVLRLAAAGGAKSCYDDIYMAAAGVRADIFSEDYNTRNDLNSTPPPGVAIVGLLKGDGKVHVLHYAYDKAMFIQFFTNWFMVPLGAFGCNLDKLDPRVKGKVVNVDCSVEQFSANAGFSGHGYQFKEGTIKYYEEHT